jgi:benzoate/toluate 1,2-dioxygenase beta subunit
VSRPDREAVEAFLYREARLMDESRYREWLDLFAEETLYWVPCNRPDGDPRREVSIIHADRAVLEAQIERLASRHVPAQEPPSRMRRLIGNVEIEPAGTSAEDGVVLVHSNFLLTEIRRHRQHSFAGRSAHRLRPDGQSGFKILFKKVDLVASDEVIENLSFLV